jgi:hypothetical protein
VAGVKKPDPIATGRNKVSSPGVGFRGGERGGNIISMCGTFPDDESVNRELRHTALPPT